MTSGIALTLRMVSSWMKPLPDERSASQTSNRRCSGSRRSDLSTSKRRPPPFSFGRWSCLAPRESERRAKRCREGRVEVGGERVQTPLGDETNVSFGDGTPSLRLLELPLTTKPDLGLDPLCEAAGLIELLRAEGGTKSASSSSELSVDETSRRRARLTGAICWRRALRAETGRLGAI